jgi:hypothetical protein
MSELVLVLGKVFFSFRGDAVHKGLLACYLAGLTNSSE